MKLDNFDNFPILFHAETEAKRVSVAGWYFVGFFLGAIGLLIVYLRSPKASMLPTNEFDGEERYIFEEAWIESLKAKQVKATWMGLILGNSFSIFWVWVII